MFAKKKTSHHHDNGNVLNRSSMDINLFNANLQDEKQIFVLVTGTKSLVEFGHLGKMLWRYIWVAGRFSKRHKRYIREEDNKFTKQVMDKLLVQMSLLVLY
jgi:hypothetical protein